MTLLAIALLLITRRQRPVWNNYRLLLRLYIQRFRPAD